jgi:hypothetical protein
MPWKLGNSQLYNEYVQKKKKKKKEEHKVWPRIVAQICSPANQGMKSKGLTQIEDLSDL